MFIAVLFTIAKIWKQPKGSSVDKWIKQLWDIYTIEYYSAIKKKKILPFAIAWIGPREHYGKWNKPLRERQIPDDFIYMWNLMNLTNKEIKDRLIDGEQMTASGGVGGG